MAMGTFLRPAGEARARLLEAIEISVKEMNLMAVLGNTLLLKCVSRKLARGDPIPAMDTFVRHCFAAVKGTKRDLTTPKGLNADKVDGDIIACRAEIANLRRGELWAD